MELRSGFLKPKREVEEAPRAGRKRPGKESVGGAASSRPHSGELGGRSSAPPRSSSARISSPSSKATSVGRGGSGAAFGSGGNSAGGRSSSSMRTSRGDSSGDQSSSSVSKESDDSSGGGCHVGSHRRNAYRRVVGLLLYIG